MPKKKTYASLEQRMAAYYLDTFPEFVPDENAPVSAAEQEEFYQLMKGLYTLAFDEPLLFVRKLHEDDALPEYGNAKSYGKPNLRNQMRTFTKAMEALLQAMLAAGRGESGAGFDKKQLAVLERLGADVNALPEAWRWLACRPDSNIIIFSRCFFRADYPYTSDIYARLFEDEEAFRKLEHWMLERGYRRYDIYNTTASDCGVSLTCANPAWSGETPVGGHEYKIRHTGISMRYEYWTQLPLRLGVCIPNGLKRFLESFALMDEALQGFVLFFSKKCDACRYCVQTDKTKKRPLSFVTVSYEDEKYRVCPLFPGSSFCWNYINEELADMLIDFLAFMDSLLPQK